ncbi:MAG: hypothetical protein PHW04_19045, partial [Candidatus Wallbacteria bacterium]|nr:hypothetical protein [Candidatus Wallbacteria bacterium]
MNTADKKDRISQTCLDSPQSLSRDFVARLAQDQIEETMRLSRTEAELLIGRYRIGIAAAMCVLSVAMTVSGVMDSWGPALFWTAVVVCALGIMLGIRRFGAPEWLSMTALTIDLAFPTAYFTLTALTFSGTMSESDSRWFIYLSPTLLLFFLSVNTLRTSRATAVYGSLLAMVLFLWETIALTGRHPAQFVVC